MLQSNKKSWIEKAAERIGLKKTYQVMVDMKINGNTVMQTGVYVSTALGSGDAVRTAEKLAMENCVLTARATDSKVIKGRQLNQLKNQINSTNEF